MPPADPSGLAHHRTFAPASSTEKLDERLGYEWMCPSGRVHKAQTAPHKYPRVVDYADSLPKTTTGKVRRAALRDRVNPLEPGA